MPTTSLHLSNIEGNGIGAFNKALKAPILGVHKRFAMSERGFKEVNDDIAESKQPNKRSDAVHGNLLNREPD